MKALILIKVWLTRRRIQNGTLEIFRLVPSLAVFLESGAIYCTVVLILTGLFFTNNSAQIIILNLVSVHVYHPI